MTRLEMTREEVELNLKLNRRELTILSVVLAGYTFGETAERLGLTQEAVERHLGNVSKKLEELGFEPPRRWW